jgi:hypothetical protein
MNLVVGERTKTIMMGRPLYLAEAGVYLGLRIRRIHRLVIDSSQYLCRFSSGNDDGDAELFEWEEPFSKVMQAGDH